MADQSRAGTILIEEGTVLPESLKFESEPYSTSWRLVSNLDGYGLDRRVREAGWSFFFLAGEARAIVFGSDVKRTIHTAITRLSARLKSERFNCLEITQVASKCFLGFPYVRVPAHWRHIQESMFLSSAKRLAEWNQAQMSDSPVEAIC